MTILNTLYLKKECFKKGKAFQNFHDCALYHRVF